jgi:flavin reductase (DIM6/NTAB) family NADH-FMN oxidoreductase RutF
MSGPIDETSFRRACARFATGVAVATVIDAAGVPHGLTVNSFTSVSLKPPLVLICVDYGSTVLPMFRAAAHFGVNVLREDQREISAKFARRGEDRFDGVVWRPGEAGVPLLEGALASFVCAMRQMVEAGDHAVLIGEVAGVEFSDGMPLLYFGSAYRRMER